MRHSEKPAATVSQSVKSVTAASPLSESRTTGEQAVAIWGKAENECAAIVAEGTDLPREWAEGFARLDPDRPRADVPPRRWVQFLGDVGRFLDSPFCAVARSLDWGPYDLFGCDRDRPFARIDQAGLLWLLDGNRLIALSANTATIETNTGTRQTFRRKPNEPGRTLPWEFSDGHHD
jgi:hypothetical protein